MDFKELAKLYKNELLENVLPFWLNHSQDLEFGGYYTCLNRNGDVFDTDKFIWLQGREVWLFSMLYNKVEKKQEWLDCAIQGGEFLKKYGHDGNIIGIFLWIVREIHWWNRIISFRIRLLRWLSGSLVWRPVSREYADIAKKNF